MATTKKIYQPHVHFEDVKSIRKSTLRKAEKALIYHANKEHTRLQNLLIDIQKLNSTYQRNFYKLISLDDVKKYLDLKRKLKNVPRLRRLRQIHHLIDGMGIDSMKATTLRNGYIKSLLKHLGSDVRNPVNAGVFDEEHSPWVTYEPPFSGTFTTAIVSRSGGAKTPTRIQYLNATTGEIGSSIATQLDDDGSLSVDNYTGLNVWHTPLADGPLEVYLVFEFLNSTYSCEVSDEWGLSDIVFNQWASAVLRVLGTAGIESQRSNIFNVIESIWGDDYSWSSYAAEPIDQHWYHFETTQSMTQGTPVLLEAGIRNVMWCDANNQSITTIDDIHLRLLKIMVRTILY
jgi:hypothetical protein